MIALMASIFHLFLHQHPLPRNLLVPFQSNCGHATQLVGNSMLAHAREGEAWKSPCMPTFALPLITAMRTYLNGPLEHETGGVPAYSQPTHKHERNPPR